MDAFKTLMERFNINRFSNYIEDLNISIISLDLVNIQRPVLQNYRTHFQSSHGIFFQNDYILVHKTDFNKSQKF